MVSDPKRAEAKEELTLGKKRLALGSNQEIFLMTFAKGQALYKKKLKIWVAEKSKTEVKAAWLEAQTCAYIIHPVL